MSLAREIEAREKRDNAKVEELAEALENLVVAVSANVLAKVKANAEEREVSGMVTEYLKNSREWLREALRKFMVPNLQLVAGVRQRNADGAHVTCGRCRQTMICADFNCPDWHAAIRKYMDKV